MKKQDPKTIKEKLWCKINNFFDSWLVNEKIWSYLWYIKKWLSEIITFSDFSNMSEKSILDTLYLIWLATSNGSVKYSKKKTDSVIIENIKQSLICQWHSEKDAEISAKILIDYIDDSLIDLLLDEKSIILKWEKNFLENMNMIYDRFYNSKLDLLENKVSAEQKWNEGCYIVAFKYDKLISGKLSELSRNIHQYLLNKKQEWKLNESADFIEYTPDNIHTSILTTPLSKDFSSSENEKNDEIVNWVKKTGLLKPIFDIKWIRINKNSIILETLPESATFLEDIKLLSKNVNDAFWKIWWARWSHITLWRFVWDITDEVILSDIYDMISEYFKNIWFDKLIPEKIIAWNLILNTEYWNWSFFKLNTIYSKNI